MAVEVTLHDVARAVGVSARTVSRVVNEQGGFSDATRARVLAAVAELGYRPNMLARALITRRSGTIGVVTEEMSDPFFTELADGVQLAARETGQTMFFSTTGGDPARQREVLRSLSAHGVDGVIISAVADTMPELLQLAEAGLPIVLLDIEAHGPNVGCVVSELADGARQAVEHLVQRGRRCIAMATNMRARSADHLPRRESGFRAALERHDRGCDESLIARAANTVEGGRESVRMLLSRRPDFDALFAYNDLMAIGAVQELIRSGRRVPDDVAVVGFDDIAMCEAMHPALSTVRIDRDRLGHRAMACLGELMNRPGAAGEPIRLPVTLVVREST